MRRDKRYASRAFNDWTADARVGGAPEVGDCRTVVARRLDISDLAYRAKARMALGSLKMRRFCSRLLHSDGQCTNRLAQEFGPDFAVRIQSPQTIGTPLRPWFVQLMCLDESPLYSHGSAEYACADEQKAGRPWCFSSRTGVPVSDEVKIDHPWNSRY